MYARIARPFVFLFVLIALVSLACGIDFGTDTPTVAPPPPTEEPSQPQNTEAPVEVSGEKFFTDEFEGDPVHWSYFTSKNKETADDSGAAPITENGFFVFELSKNLNVYATYDDVIYENVRIDARVDNRGSNNNNVNLICRYSDEGWYEVAIANNGLYWIYAYDGKVYNQMANGGSNKIRQGKDVNEYTFICHDRNVSLLINGVDTKTYTDNKYVLRDGQIGIGLSSFEDQPIKVEFDWVKVSEP